MLQLVSKNELPKHFVTLLAVSLHKILSTNTNLVMFYTRLYNKGNIRERQIISSWHNVLQKQLSVFESMPMHKN